VTLTFELGQDFCSVPNHQV